MGIVGRLHPKQLLAYATLCVAVTAGLWPLRDSYAYDFNISARTEAYGYQLRRKVRDGVEFANRRRITQYMGLRVYNLLDPGEQPHASANTQRPPALLYMHGLMRFRTDFGDFAEAAGNDNPELSNDDFELLLGAVEGRNLWGLVDFTLGRQFDSELMDFFAYDGLRIRVHTPWSTYIEGHAGFQVDRSQPFSSAVFESDGTSGSTDDDDAMAPVFGGAIGIESPRGVEVRFAYRAMGSWARPVAQEQAGDAPWGIDRELLFSHLVVPITAAGPRLSAALRYNILLAQFDELNLSATQSFGSHFIELEFAQSQPHFGGDSIFNVFGIEPYSEVSARYALDEARGWQAETQLGYRWFSAAGESERDAPWAVSAAAMLRWSGSATTVDGGLFYLGDADVNQVGGDVTGRWLSSPIVFGKRLGISGRASVVRSDHERDKAVTTLGLQLGALVHLLPSVRLHVVFEDNISRLFNSALRLFAALDMEFSP